MSVLHDDARRDAFDFRSHFREDFYACLTRRGDTLFEVTDAMLCENGPVTSPVDLTLVAEHRRGHGALYDALNCGRIDVDGLRRALAVLPQPKAADRWTWIVIAAHTQLRLTREAAADLRRPWEKPAEPARLTPARVRRGFGNIRPHLHNPARAPKPSTPGPGRPVGSKNRRPATRYDVGKTAKRPESITERN